VDFSTFNQLLTLSYCVKFFSTKYEEHLSFFTSSVYNFYGKLSQVYYNKHFINKNRLTLPLSRKYFTIYDFDIELVN